MLLKQQNAIIINNMENQVLLKNPLFSGIKETKLPAVLDFLSASERDFIKGESVFHSGTVINQIGIVIE